MKKIVLLKDNEGNAILPITEAKNVIGAVSYVYASNFKEVDLEIDSSELPHSITEE